ncbi:hypothetical protein [Tunturiibacter gelidiferens]|uniref:DUF2069 domain-containing protein n=1 Tax=Tunturiibacter gelidiferens TaxID=3069689 RepID=A0AAU7YY58_9BACT
MNRKSRAKDLFLYVLISGAIIALLVVVIELGVDRRTFMNGTGFAFFTLPLFGFFVESSRRWWKKPLFWSLAGLLFVLHSMCFWWIAYRAGLFKPAWYPILILEYAVLIACRNLVLAKADNSS